MKKATLLVLTSLIIGIAAHAKNDEQKDPENKPAKKEYRFGLNTSCFNIFSLFSIQPTRKDSVKTDDKHSHITFPAKD